MKRTTETGLIILLGLAIVLVAWAASRLFQGTTRSDSPLTATTPNRNTSTENGMPRITLNMATRGGLCVYGGCNETLTLYASGQYRITRKEADQAEDRVLRSGTLPSETTILLLDLINATDFDALRTTPFTDICPTAYDGSETTYTFTLKNGQQEILDTCQHVLDFHQPLLRETQSLPTSGQ